jgi:hypothetical protein
MEQFGFHAESLFSAAVRGRSYKNGLRPFPRRSPLPRNILHQRQGVKGSVWHPLVAKCILPENASFAILQVVASRVSDNAKKVATFGEQFADDMQLVLKTVR